MGNRTTRKSKLNKKPVETKTELAMHAKKLYTRTLKRYFTFALPLFVVELALLLSMLAVSRSVGSTMGIVLICLDGIVTLTYFVIFDAVPARKMKKDGNKNTKLTPNQVKVFYAALKAQTIVRTIANVLMTATILIIALTVFVM